MNKKKLYLEMIISTPHVGEEIRNYHIETEVFEGDTLNVLHKAIKALYNDNLIYHNKRVIHEVNKVYILI